MGVSVPVRCRPVALCCRRYHNDHSMSFVPDLRWPVLFVLGRFNTKHMFCNGQRCHRYPFPPPPSKRSRRSRPTTHGAEDLVYRRRHRRSGTEDPVHRRSTSSQLTPAPSIRSRRTRPLAQAPSMRGRSSRLTAQAPSKRSSRSRQIPRHLYLPWTWSLISLTRVVVFLRGGSSSGHLPWASRYMTYRHPLRHGSPLVSSLSITSSSLCKSSILNAFFSCDMRPF